MTSPLLISHQESLIDEMLRLAAAAGVTPVIARDASSALRGWAGAPLVLLGVDMAAEMAALGPARRAGLHLVARGRVDDDMFRTALSLGAENIAELPRSEGWLVEAMTDLGDRGRVRGLTVGVIGGSGGAGATTFACALGQMAARSGPAVIIDTDALGPGLDRMLGLEMKDGIRWDALCQTTGRLSARALREALPQQRGLGVLTWYAGTSVTLQAFAVREAMSAAQRGHDAVVVDLPRAADPLFDEIVARCDALLVVVTPSVAGIASTTRLCRRFGDRDRIGLVLRGSGVAARDVATLTGVGVMAEMSDQRRLAEAIDLGLGPVRSHRGNLGRAASDVLARLNLATRPAAAA